MSKRSLNFANAEKFCHFVVKKAFARPIRLYPFAVNHELRDGPLASLPDDFLGSAWRGLDVNFGVRNVVLLQEALGDAAVRAPESGIDEEFHLSGSQSGADLARERRMLDWRRFVQARPVARHWNIP